MSKFKVGQKVKVIQDVGEPYLLGKTGIVRVFEPESVGVEFKGWGGGHRFENNEIALPDGWYFDEEDLKILPARKKVTRRKKKSAN